MGWDEVAVAPLHWLKQVFDIYMAYIYLLTYTYTNTVLIYDEGVWCDQYRDIWGASLHCHLWPTTGNHVMTNENEKHSIPWYISKKEPKDYQIYLSSKKMKPQNTWFNTLSWWKMAILPTLCCSGSKRWKWGSLFCSITSESLSHEQETLGFSISHLTS